MITLIPKNTKSIRKPLKKQALRFFIHTKNTYCYSGASKIAGRRFFIHTKNKELLYIQKIGEDEKKRFKKFLQIEYDYLKYLYSLFLKTLLRIYSSGSIPLEVIFKFYCRCVSTGTFENKFRGEF